MNQRHASSARRHGRRIIIFLGALFGVAALLLWARNTLAVDLCGAPGAQFKHALALVFAVTAVAGLLQALKSKLSPI